MELPVQLEEHIKVLMQSNILAGWSIFSERNGGISVKIRFKGTCEGPTESVGFKRKSMSQISRDRKRQNSCQIGVTTRSKSKIEEKVSSIETARGDNFKCNSTSHIDDLHTLLTV